MSSAPSRAHQLLALGQSVWLDFIRRGHLVSGEFDRDVRDAGVVGVTSNPTIFQQAIAGSSDYDAALSEAAARGLEGELGAPHAERLRALAAAHDRPGAAR